MKLLIDRGDEERPAVLQVVQTMPMARPLALGSTDLLSDIGASPNIAASHVAGEFCLLDKW